VSSTETVIFSVGSRPAVRIPDDENIILAKNLPLDGAKPGYSLFSLQGLLGRNLPGEAFWPSGAAGGQPASGAQIGFWVIRLLLAASVLKRTTDEHRWTQILKAGFGISFTFLRITVR
jgi:hypothetical protein